MRNLHDSATYMRGKSKKSWYDLWSHVYLIGLFALFLAAPLVLSRVGWSVFHLITITPTHHQNLL